MNKNHISGILIILSSFACLLIGITGITRFLQFYWIEPEYQHLALSIMGFVIFIIGLTAGVSHIKTPNHKLAKIGITLIMILCFISLLLSFINPLNISQTILPLIIMQIITSLSTIVALILSAISLILIRSIKP